jgi:hypothetical protein
MTNVRSTNKDVIVIMDDDIRTTLAAGLRLLSHFITLPNIHEHPWEEGDIAAASQMFSDIAQILDEAEISTHIELRLPKKEI